MNIPQLIHITYPDTAGKTDDEWMAELAQRIDEHNPKKGDRVVILRREGGEIQKDFVLEYPDFYLMERKEVMY